MIFLSLLAGILAGGFSVYVVLSSRIGKMKVSGAARDAEIVAEREKVEALKLQYAETMRQAESRFKTLAQEILEDRGRKMQADGEKGMRSIAEGVENSIREFKARIEKINSETVERSGKLDERISGLISQTNQVSDQANRLAEAIRGEAQVTGLWGEMQLKKVLELGGLQESVDYTYQETFASCGSGHKDIRTDVLVKMTDGRWLVVDAKTTMAAYVDYKASSEPAEKGICRERIVESLQRHVEEMKSADYRKKLEQATGKKVLNTMLMYIPFDEVYLIAMKAETTIGRERVLLRDWALKNGIVFINATGLLPVARMLCDFWSTAKAEKRAGEIKAAAEALVDKFRMFISGKDGFADLGNHLAAAVRSYNSSLGRLSKGPGNIVKRISAFEDMGVDTGNFPAEDEVASREVVSVVVN